MKFEINFDHGYIRLWIKKQDALTLRTHRVSIHTMTMTVEDYLKLKTDLNYFAG